MEWLLNHYDSELLSRFMKRGERAGNGPREVHLPLIVTKADGPYRCRTKEDNHGPTQAHRHNSKVVFKS